MRMEKPVILALDFSSIEKTVEVLDKLDPASCRVKVGKQLFVSEGPKVIKKIQKLGFEIFLDLKFHDIPNTVKEACLAAADLGVWMVNIHASGGRAMLEAASDAYAKLTEAPLLIGVTVLTSLSEDQFDELGYSGNLTSAVERLAVLSCSSGLDGVVCSPKELKLLSRVISGDFLYVTPGIRFDGEDSHDQSRIATPQSALEEGADYLVMGRSILESENPSTRVLSINNLTKKNK